MKRVVLVLVGPIESGKSTVAKRLHDRHGFEVMKFAAPLKAMVRALGLTDDEIEGHMKAEPCALLHGRTPRYVMQTLGTEWGRHCIHPNFWADMLVQGIRLSGMNRIVIDDCRFLNEASVLRSSVGATFIRLLGRGKRDDHASEQEYDLIPVDKYLDNCGTLDELHELVDLLAESVTRKYDV